MPVESWAEGDLHCRKTAAESGRISQKVTLQDEYGEVDFIFSRFLKPGYVRTVFDGEMPESYSKAVQMLLERELVDTTKRKRHCDASVLYRGRSKDRDL